MLKLPHAERVRVASATRRPAPSCATRSSTTTATRRRARRCRRRCGTRCSSTRSRSPSTRSSRARSISEIADERGVAPADAMLDLALAEDLATEFRWRTESPEWAAAVGEAQRDARMMIGVSDGGAHLARDDGADWSSYFLRSWVLDRKVWTLEEGIRQITQVPAALRRPRRPRRAHARRSGRPHGVRPRHDRPVEKEFVHDLPGGVGRFKAWGKGVQATIVNGEPIVLRRRAHRPPARPGRAARHDDDA